MRQLPAGIFEQDFAIDGQRRGKEIQTQDCKENSDTGATVQEQDSLRRSKEIEAGWRDQTPSKGALSLKGTDNFESFHEGLIFPEIA